MTVSAWVALFAAIGAAIGAIITGVVLRSWARRDRELENLRLAISTMQRDLAAAGRRPEPWWVVLRIRREAGREEIRRAYRALSRAAARRGRHEPAAPETARLRVALAQALTGLVEAGRP